MHSMRFEQFIQIFKPISPLAWLPLLLFIFQDINMTAISTIFITSIWPIIINTALGVKSVSEDYMNVAKVLRFTAFEKIVPNYFTGISSIYFYRNETITCESLG